jgi:hypothetical protein
MDFIRETYTKLRDRETADKQEIKGMFNLDEDFNIEFRIDNDGFREGVELGVVLDQPRTQTHRLYIKDDGSFEYSTSTSSNNNDIEKLNKQIETSTKIKAILENKDLQKQALTKGSSILSSRRELNKVRAKFINWDNKL